jgi:phage host-nuclease inhibitor protein Gam
MKFEQWLKINCFQEPTPEAIELARSAWITAKRDDYVTEMEEYVKLTEASYQSKRAKLKKQITHFIGKFMIVKTENNRLRTLVKNAKKSIDTLQRENMRLQALVNDKDYIVEKQLRQEYKDSSLAKEPIKC